MYRGLLQNLTVAIRGTIIFFLAIRGTIIFFVAIGGLNAPDGHDPRYTFEHRS
jgi:hypothetical protein